MLGGKILRLSTNNDNLKHRYRLSWYEMRIFLYQFVLTFFPVILLSAFATYIYVTKSYEKLEVSTEATATQMQMNLDELFTQLQGYYVGAADDDRVKWFIEEKAQYSDYSKLVDVAGVLNGNSVFSDYIDGFSIVNFRTQLVLSSRGMHEYIKLDNKDEVRALYERNKENFNPYYWLYSPVSNTNAIFPREHVDYEGLCLILRLPTIGRYSNAMLVVNLNSNALVRKVTNNIADFDGAIVTDDGKVVYASDNGLIEKILSQDDVSRIRLSNGKSYIIEKKPSKVFGINYYVAGDASAAWGDVDNIWTGTIVILALSAVMFLAVIWSSRKLYQPIAALSEKVGNLAGGLTDDSTDLGTDETAMTDAAEKNDRAGNAAHRVNELESIAKQVDILVNNKEQAEETSMAHKGELLSMTEKALVKGGFSADELNRNIEQLGFECRKYYMAAVGIIRNIDTHEPVDNIAMRGIIDRLPADIMGLFYLPAIVHSDVIVLTAASDGEVMLNMKMERLYNLINARLFGEGLRLELVMGVSSVREKLTELRNAYKEARKAIESKLREGEKLVFYSEEENKNKVIYNYDTMLEKRIKEAVEKCDMEAASSLMDEFVDGMFSHGVGNDNYVYVYRMIMTVIMVPSELGVATEQDIKDSDIFSKASQIFDADRLKKYLKDDVLEPVILMIDEAQGRRSSEIMNKIKQTVKEKDGDITLTECAEILDYHPNYLWKIIKNELGITFTEYVAQYKIERAKELLTQTDMSVAAIAEQLKYTNAQNFIRFFSKMTDITPGKYRQEFKKR